MGGEVREVRFGITSPAAAARGARELERRIRLIGAYIHTWSNSALCPALMAEVQSMDTPAHQL
eukprot:scaffold216655_cov17-Tisochrysis_lutea.AAC.2